MNAQRNEHFSYSCNITNHQAGTTTSMNQTDNKAGYFNGKRISNCMQDAVL